MASFNFNILRLYTVEVPFPRFCSRCELQELLQLVFDRHVNDSLSVFISIVCLFSLVSLVILILSRLKFISS